MYITLEDLYGFCMFIIALIILITDLNDRHNKK
jgi:hypothetical protein